MPTAPSPSRRRTSAQARLIGLALILVLLALVLWLFVGALDRPRVVLYCAHDVVYAQKIIRDFEKAAGLKVDVRFDTEATKSLGLAELIVREKDQPRCDVFWNNQVLTTLDLAERGLLEAYKGPGWQRIPEAYRDPEGRWAGFAARFRVHIVNTKKTPADADAVARAWAADDLSRVTIAKPLYGTTLTHYTVLWQLWGPDRLKAWHHDCRKRGIQETGGNAMVKNIVAQGVCDLGLTDSDDFFEARDEGKPVAMLPVRIGLEGGADDPSQFRGRVRGRTILIPNTVAIVKGTRRLDAARKLADYLLSKECELALARSKARQVPLGPVDDAELTEDVRQLKAWAKEGVPMSNLGQAHRQCLAWLKAEYLK